jgi:hypothetical protein
VAALLVGHSPIPGLLPPRALPQAKSVATNCIPSQSLISKITSLTGSDYAALVREAALAGIQGGAIYDAVLLKSAVKADVERIYTLNQKHFQAVAPKSISCQILSP